jgi:hypothetical protein
LWTELPNPKGNTMTTDTDLITYLEAQRKRRLTILGWVLGVSLIVGGVAFFATRPSKEDVRNDRTEELTRALLGEDD